MSLQDEPERSLSASSTTPDPPLTSESLEESAVRDVIYSSCHVDSLARDLAAMPSFRADEARLFDMFPQTNHDEVMVPLHRDGGQTRCGDVPARI
ncbi:MAG TPA: hypothetical protein VFG98_02545 [Intrasporangium sp.]|nr:hypothetical protein [Intrasporangium sp.]